MRGFTIAAKNRVSGEFNSCDVKQGESCGWETVIQDKGSQLSSGRAAFVVSSEQWAGFLLWTASRGSFRVCLQQSELPFLVPNDLKSIWPIGRDEDILFCVLPKTKYAPPFPPFLFAPSSVSNHPVTTWWPRDSESSCPQAASHPLGKIHFPLHHRKLLQHQGRQHPLLRLPPWLPQLLEFGCQWAAACGEQGALRVARQARWKGGSELCFCRCLLHLFLGAGRGVQRNLGGDRVAVKQRKEPYSRDRLIKGVLCIFLFSNSASPGVVLPSARWLQHGRVLPHISLLSFRWLLPCCHQVAVAQTAIFMHAE